MCQEKNVNMATFRAMKRIFNLWTLGFHGPSYMQKYIYCQLIVFLTFLFVWVKFNGGKFSLPLELNKFYF